MYRLSRVHPFAQDFALSAGLAGCLLFACGKPSADELYAPIFIEVFDAGASNDASGGAGAGGQAGSTAMVAATGGQGVGGQTTMMTRDGGVQTSLDSSDAALSVDSGISPESDAGTPRECVPSNELCDGVDNDCDNVVDEGLTCVPECTGFVLNGIAYKYCADGESVQVAQTRCQLDGMRLAWVETEQEGSALAAQVGSFEPPPGFPDIDPQRPVRLGATDSQEEGEWNWIAEIGPARGPVRFWEGDSGGEAVAGSYAPWSTGQPNDASENEDCGVLLVFDGPDGQAGQWNDVSCTSLYYFVCEVPN